MSQPTPRFNMRRSWHSSQLRRRPFASKTAPLQFPSFINTIDTMETPHTTVDSLMGCLVPLRPKVLPTWLGTARIAGGMLRVGGIDLLGGGGKGTILPVVESILVLPMRDCIAETIDSDSAG